MGSLLPLFALLAVAKKPKDAAPAAPPPVPDPVLPIGDARAPAAPHLTGHGAVLALDGLDRDTFTFTFDADTAVLASLEPATVDAVFGALAADPTWRVTRDAGGRVAWLRTAAEGHVVGPDGWHADGGGCWRVGLREGGAIEPDWEASPHVVRVRAGTPRIALHGFRPDETACGAIATALRVDGPMAVEVFEAGPAEGRPVTRDALGDLPAAVIDAAAAARTVRADGFDALALPEGEPMRIERATATLAPAGPGALVYRARVNPGEPGWAWLRILADGVPWAEPEVGAATLEAPGWSRDATHGFYLQATVCVPAGAAFAGVAEVWFQGADGGPRRLCAEPVTVPAR